MRDTRKYKRRILTVRPMPTRVTHFPIDMLRYSRCLPFDESESLKIMRSIEGYAKEEIKLYRYVAADGGGRAIEVPDNERARWASFGWEIVSQTADTF